jgi:DNA-binding cell septation regulator SpoVG
MGKSKNKTLARIGIFAQVNSTVEQALSVVPNLPFDARKSVAGEQDMTLPKIEVTIRLVDKPGSTKAHADVRLLFSDGEMLLLGFAVIQQGIKPLWVGFPEIAGRSKYFPVVEAKGQIKKAIIKAILDAYEEIKVSKKVPGLDAGSSVGSVLKPLTSHDGIPRVQPGSPEAREPGSKRKVRPVGSGLGLLGRKFLGV